MIRHETQHTQTHAQTHTHTPLFHKLGTRAVLNLARIHPFPLKKSGSGPEKSSLQWLLVLAMEARTLACKVHFDQLLRSSPIKLSCKATPAAISVFNNILNDLLLSYFHFIFKFVIKLSIMFLLFLKIKIISI